MKNYNIKTNRTFTAWRQWGWLLTVIVAFGGLYEPKLGLIVPLIIIGLTGTSLFRGRFWCGNVCAHGSLYDNILLEYSNNTKIPKLFRSKILIIAFFLWMGIKLSYKSFTVFSNFEGMQLLDKLGFIFVSTYIMVFIISVPIGLIFTPRTWCQFCPMGTIQKVSYKLGKILGINKKTDVKISIESKSLCHTCGKCSRVCPMQLEPYLEFDKNNQFSNENCIKCSTCVQNCPAKILSLDTLEVAKKKTEEIEAKHDLSKTEFEATISKITYIEKDVMEIIFDLGRNKVNYKAGQFISVRIMDEPKQNRAYTISGFDKDKNELRITVKKVPNGFGTGIIFDTFKEGNKIILDGPMGHELIVDKNSENLVLVAAGIGITPFVPILKDLKASNYKGNVTLVYGARYEKELFYKDEVNSIIKDELNMSFVPVLSREKNYDGKKGYVTDVIKEMNLVDTKIYMCAAPKVAKGVENVLKHKNFNTKDFFVETA